MKKWSRIPKYIRIISLLLIFLVLFALILYKPLRVLNLQARGGNFIKKFIEQNAAEYENYFTCQIPALTNLRIDQGLENAVTLLEKAHNLWPQNAQTNLLLGRAYCLKGDYDSALDAFESFNQIKPENPLGTLESAFSHFILSVDGDNVSDELRIYHRAESRKILEGEGASGEYFLNKAKHADDIGDYVIAWYWYRLAEIFFPLPDQIAFRASVLEAVFKQSFSFPEEFVKDYFSIIDGSTTIAPTAFFRINSGNAVSVKEIEEQKAAVYTTNNDAGGTFIGINQSGNYCISFQALDRSPEPTLIEVTHNLNQMKTLRLVDGDNSWKTFELKVFLSEGYHLLGFRLTNDYYQATEAGIIDRNGYVGLLKVEICEN